MAAALKRDYGLTAAVEAWMHRDGTVIVCLRQSGRFGFAVAGTPAAVRVNGKTSDYARRGELYVVDCTGEAGRIFVEVCF